MRVRAAGVAVAGLTWVVAKGRRVVVVTEVTARVVAVAA